MPGYKVSSYKGRYQILRIFVFPNHSFGNVNITLSLEKEVTTENQGMLYDNFLLRPSPNFSE